MDALVASILVAAVPLLLAALGELVAERAGVLNLGVEGMMILGAVFGFIAAVESQSALAGFAAGAAAGALAAGLFAVLVLRLVANQVATGLGLTLFGLGLAALVGQPYAGVKPPPVPRPETGLRLLDHDPVFWLAYAAVPLIALVLWRTRAGLALRAAGENPEAAHALGHRVLATRFAATLFGGAMAGLGGAYLSLVRVPQWSEGMTAGAGWIALAIVVFAAWRPDRALLGALLFGGVTFGQLTLQASGQSLSVFGMPIQSYYLSMAPYLATILVLVLMSGRRAGAPAALGKPFLRSG